MASTGGRYRGADAMRLLERVVVPPRLALILRDGETLGYNPALNTWTYLEEDTAETLRWLRAGRERGGLGAHLGRRFSTAPSESEARLMEILQWCILRRMLYLDRVPEIPEIQHPENPLATVYWICTQACNLRCTYCYQSAAKPRPNELTTAEGMRLIDQVVELGARTFIFTGGEPFFRPDLLELARYSRDAGLRTNVITNGQSIDEANIDDVAAIFHNVTVSLDHGLPEHHDRNRGEGSWEKAVGAIDLLLEHGVAVDINSVLTYYGLADLHELLAFVRRRRIGDHRIVPQFPMGRGRASRARTGELTAGELLGLEQQLRAAAAGFAPDEQRSSSPEGVYSTKGMRRNHCGAGLSEVSVDPEGWVYPCRLLQDRRFRTDNVRSRPLIDIVANHPALKSIRATVVERLEPCRTCIIKSHCGGGCRGIHFSFTHDYVKAHPMFCAYLRRMFEGKAWESTGHLPPPRRAEFVEQPADLEDPQPEPAHRVFVPLSLVTRR